MSPDPSWLEPRSLCPDEAAARAGYLLRGHVLARLAEALGEGPPVMLVKGAALAETVYPKPWQRPMGDLDVLVQPRDQPEVLARLTKAGFEPQPAPPGRPLSFAAFGERVLRLQTSRWRLDVDLHTRLDKLVARPIPHEAIFARACRGLLPGALLVPSPEDHLLLVVVHAAAGELRHRAAWTDLEMLARAGLDWAAVERRARTWRLNTALALTLRTWRQLGSLHVPAGLIERLSPRGPRRWLLSAGYGLDAIPPARGPFRGGLWWVLRQTPLRDDVAGWGLGVAGYALRRAAERLAARPPARGRP